MFVNFREVQRESRNRMRGINPRKLQDLENAETKNSAAIWILIKDWPGCLDHMPPERPHGRGQIFRVP